MLPDRCRLPGLHSKQTYLHWQHRHHCSKVGSLLTAGRSASQSTSLFLRPPRSYKSWCYWHPPFCGQPVELLSLYSLDMLDYVYTVLDFDPIVSAILETQTCRVNHSFAAHRQCCYSVVYSCCNMSPRWQKISVQKYCCYLCILQSSNGTSCLILIHKTLYSQAYTGWDNACSVTYAYS